MIFTTTSLQDALLVEMEPYHDQRGFFARVWCEKEFDAIGIKMRCVQCNLSFNQAKGTLRGMHFQKAPYAEAKLIRCLRGAIYDVIIDLRRDSPTFKQWMAVHLTAENRRMLFVPGGFAHGFQTLEDCTEVFYQMSEFYVPDYAGGVRWNDPAFRIHWPDDQRIISERDQHYPDFQS